MRAGWKEKGFEKVGLRSGRVPELLQRASELGAREDLLDGGREGGRAEMYR